MRSWGQIKVKFYSLASIWRLCLNLALTSFDDVSKNNCKSIISLITWCRLSMSRPRSMSIGCSSSTEKDVVKKSFSIRIWTIWMRPIILCTPTPLAMPAHLDIKCFCNFKGKYSLWTYNLIWAGICYVQPVHHISAYPGPFRSILVLNKP